MLKLWKMLLFTVLVVGLIGCSAAESASPDEEIVTQETTSEPTEEMMGTEEDMHQDGMMGDAPVDALFIDGMIPHHQMAIDMSQQALEQAEYEELRAMAQQIIEDQQREIEQMETWRDQWYPDLEQTMGMQMESMPMGEDMMMSTDESIPFDLRFIDAMIPHHQGAIMMAQQILDTAEHEDLRQMARQIIDAQQAEIEQLEHWREEWYPDAP